MISAERVRDFILGPRFVAAREALGRARREHEAAARRLEKTIADKQASINFDAFEATILEYSLLPEDERRMRLKAMRTHRRNRLGW